MRLILGDSLEELDKLEENSVHSIVIDPPYEIGFMNKGWDNTGIATTPAIWQKALRVIKPGGYMLAFSSTRTMHRIATSIEQAGWQVRDTICWHYACLSEDTEILTENGWRKKDTIKKDDIIFSMNLKNEKIIPNKVNHVFEYDYNGTMINLKNHNTDQLLTPNHKVICKNGRKDNSPVRKVIKEKVYKYEDAGNIDSTVYELPLAGYYDGDYSIGSLFAELIGWILSEGHFKKTSNSISIYQSSVNSKKCSRIRYILGRCKIQYSEYSRKREYNYKHKGIQEYTEYQWYFSGDIVDKIKKIIPNKKPTKKLWHLPLKEKERLIYGLCEGDGTTSPLGRHNQFYQKDEEFLEWFQVLIHLTGIQGWVNIKKWVCGLNYNNSTQIQSKHFPNRKVEYKGKVWCIETEMGNFVARRNGKIFITGNSGFPHGSNIGKATGDPNWTGFNTSLKPATELIILARKSITEKTVAKNCLKHGVGALNIDGCRIRTTDKINDCKVHDICGVMVQNGKGRKEGVIYKQDPIGRYPANCIFQCICDKVIPGEKGKKTYDYTGEKEYNVEGFIPHIKPNSPSNRGDTNPIHTNPACQCYELDRQSGGDGASRFFQTIEDDIQRFLYVAKPSKREKNAGCEDIEPKKYHSDGRKTFCDVPQKRAESKAHNNHPTVKPVKLLQYLITMITPKGGTVLDFFMGSGSAGMAADNLGFDYIGIELDSHYYDIAVKRIAYNKEEREKQADLDQDIFRAKT